MKSHTVKPLLITKLEFEARFQLLNIIGKGTYGDVWKAYDKKVGSLVAVKVLKDESHKDTTDIE